KQNPKRRGSERKNGGRGKSEIVLSTKEEENKNRNPNLKEEGDDDTTLPSPKKRYNGAASPAGTLVDLLVR
ncbi:hypothetical protein Golob_010394, partial [Gossypium lobatum]|nr:hypothetical protein [Gossypium lobatum]